jgi:hypothetical protein
MHPAFLKKKQEGQNFYVLPDEFKGIAATFKFPGVNEVASVLIDFGKLLRDKKPLVKPHTFSKQIKMNQAGPQRFKCFKVAKGFSPTLAYQPILNLMI